VADLSGVKPSEIARVLDDALPLATGPASLYVAEIKRAAAWRALKQITADVRKNGRPDHELLAALKAGLSGVEAAEAGGGPLPLVSAPDLVGQEGEELQQLVADLLTQATVAMLLGVPGVAKTFLALAICVAVASGGTVLGRQCIKRPVVFINRDNPDALIRARLKLLGAPPGLSIWPASASPPLLDDGPGPYLRLIEPGQHPLLVFDAFRRFYTGDENSASDVAPVMSAFRELAAQGATILVIHHAGKGEGASAYRGSSEIAAAVDVAWVLRKEGEDLELATVKDRLGPPDCKIPLRFSVAADRAVFVDTSTERAAAARGQRSEAIGHLRAILAKAKGGLNQSEIVAKAGAEMGLGRREVRALLEAGLAAGAWTARDGQYGATIYRVTSTCSSCSGAAADRLDRVSGPEGSGCSQAGGSPPVGGSPRLNSPARLPSEEEDEGGAYGGREF
jgi:hypothetical protein